MQKLVEILLPLGAVVFAEVGVHFTDVHGFLRHLANVGLEPVINVLLFILINHLHLVFVYYF